VRRSRSCRVPDVPPSLFRPAAPRILSRRRGGAGLTGARDRRVGVTGSRRRLPSRRARWTTPPGCGRPRTSGPAAPSPGSRCRRAARASRRSPRTASLGCDPSRTTSADQTTDPISIALCAISRTPSRERRPRRSGARGPTSLSTRRSPR
jgi:hypothetical protein